jgi:hypothetical protein
MKSGIVPGVLFDPARLEKIVESHGSLENYAILVHKQALLPSGAFIDRQDVAFIQHKEQASFNKVGTTKE